MISPFPLFSTNPQLPPCSGFIFMVSYSLIVVQTHIFLNI